MKECHSILVSRLREYEVRDDPWSAEFEWSLLHEVTHEEVAKANVPFDKIYTERYSCRDPRCGDARWHAARILYLVDHPDQLSTPISVDNLCMGDIIYAVPEIIDGWHRFFAHLFLNRERILCTYGGHIDLLDYLKGETFTPPPSC